MKQGGDEVKVEAFGKIPSNAVSGLVFIAALSTMAKIRKAPDVHQQVNG